MDKIDFYARRSAWTALRREHGITRVDELAHALDVPRRNLGRTVEGRRPATPALTARTLHAFPDCAFGDLFTVQQVAR